MTWYVVEKLTILVNMCSSNYIIHGRDYNDLSDEELRRDEKRGLYNEHEDISN